MDNHGKKIGIFDSGIGGLAVFRALHKDLPGYDYTYVADSAYAPYGNKSHKEIFVRAHKALLYLQSQSCALMIIACNSASCQALRALQEKYNTETFRVIGILVPTAEAALKTSTSKRIGVLSTEATKHAGTYIDRLKQINPTVKVFNESASELSTLIETRASKEDLMKELIPPLKALKENAVDTVILGCTHYELVQNVVREILPKNITVLVTGAVISSSLQKYFLRHDEMTQSLSSSGTCNFFTTGEPEIFTEHLSWICAHDHTATQIVL